MKFAHEFKEALLREGFPADWVASAIPYGQLKKCIKKVEGELRQFGLDRTTLKRLDLTNAQRAGRDGSVAFQYRFNADKNFRPKLILFLQPDGLAIDATLSLATRQYLEELASSQEHQLGHVESTDSNESVTSKTCAEEKLQKQSEESHATAIDTERPVIRSIEVPLTFDTEFFGLIQSDVTNIDTLQETEQRSITNEILALSEEIRTLAQPSQFNKKVLRHSKTDLSSWRQLFDIYLQACIFFSNHELDHGSRSSSVAVEKLNWFQSQVMKLGIADSFKLPASHQALDRFVRINVNLLRSLKFQEINKTAITKILKKFDKRTMLGATKTFPKLIQSESLMSENMAKAVCSQISQELVKLVPQVDDYTCPICLSIVWRPVRLGCGHMFCSLCLVKMQEDRDKHCPLCRDDKVMDADEANIDVNLGKFLKKYFPAEVKQKQIELETAAGIRQWGVLYKHPSESQTKCHVM